MAASEPNGNATLADHERLVNALYQPGADVAKINAVLTRYQRSQQGWQFADQLLQSQEAQVRFFGALTFTIKINTDWDSINPDHVPALLQRLLTWTIQLVHAREQAFVLRKLCSALVAYFLRPSTLWDKCVRHLTCCFAAGKFVTPEETTHFPSTCKLLISLSTLQLKTLVWFSTTLVEEVGKTSSQSSQTYGFHEKVCLNLEDTAPLLRFLLNDSKEDDVIVQESIKSYQAWVNYVHRSSEINAPNSNLECLKSLTPVLLEKLTVETLFEDAVEFFTDVLVNFPAFFSSETYTLLAATLTSHHAKEWLSALKAGDFEEEAQDFSRLLFAFGDAAVQDLAQDVHVKCSQQILTDLLDLLDAQGYGGAELQICSQAVEFWQTYTEFVTDSLFSAGEKQEAWMTVAKQRVAKALQHSWSKIRTPTPNITAPWDSETRSSFRSLRQDFVDLVQAAFPLLGLTAFEYFAQLALDCLQNQAWYDLEAALIGLNALSDSVAGDPDTDGTLSSIFRSSLFNDMMSPEAAVPHLTQMTALTTITDYTSFFERQTELLPDMLNFLFAYLGHPTIASVAAKAISSTCSSCRKHLTKHINGFLHAYKPYSRKDPFVKEKILGAIAMIIQALPSEEERMGPLSSLVSCIEQDATVSHEMLRANRIEESLTNGMCALRSLTSVGKGLQMPDEAVIDLEEESDQSSAWLSPSGQDLQTRVIRILHAVTSSLSFDNSIVEAGCQVLRTGYKETTPGLLVFPPQFSVEFVSWGCSSGLSFTGVNYIIETATALLGKKKDASSPSMSSAATAIWSLILGLIMSYITNGITDPEVIASFLCLGEKMIPHHLSSLFEPQILGNLHYLFELSIRSLNTPELMPKRTAASFWALFVQKHECSRDIAERIHFALQQYGPQLGHAFIRNISGGAARSELDIISLPLKKLVFSQPQAKTWLSDALESESFLSDKVDIRGRRLWLQKILGLRGGAQTNIAVKEFWMACHGSNMDYAS